MASVAWRLSFPKLAFSLRPFCMCVPALDYHGNLKERHTQNHEEPNLVKILLCHGKDSKTKVFHPVAFWRTPRLSFLPAVQTGFLACSSVRHACIYVFASDYYDNPKHRHICKCAEVNQVWVFLMACRIEERWKTHSSIHIKTATVRWRFQDQRLYSRLDGEAPGDWMGALWMHPVRLLLYICDLVIYHSFFTVVYVYVSVVWDRLVLNDYG